MVEFGGLSKASLTFRGILDPRKMFEMTHSFQVTTEETS